jgi:hypothetical protein
MRTRIISIGFNLRPPILGDADDQTLFLRHVSLLFTPTIPLGYDT